jgi:hypothetical protein
VLEKKKKFGHTDGRGLQQGFMERAVIQERCEQQFFQRQVPSSGATTG